MNQVWLDVALAAESVSLKTSFHDGLMFIDSAMKLTVKDREKMLWRSVACRANNFIEALTQLPAYIYLKHFTYDFLILSNLTNCDGGEGKTHVQIFLCSNTNHT